MAEISQNKPSDVMTFMALKSRADMCTLDDGEETFRDSVHQAGEPKKKYDEKKRPRSDANIMRQPSPRNCEKAQQSQKKPTIISVPSDKPAFDIQNDDELSDLDLVESKDVGEYTADHYTVDTDETDALSSQDKPEVVIFANDLQIVTPKQRNDESVLNDEIQNQTINPDVQPLQPGVSRQNMHEGSERHVTKEQPDSMKPEIELTAEEQKAVDDFIRATENSERTKSELNMHIVHTNKDLPQAEMKRLLVVPMQLITTPQSEDTLHAKLENSIHQVDPLSTAGTAGTDKGNQESMNFSQFSGSSSDMKNMAENSKIATHNLVSTNPAAEFMETLKQNFKQFGKLQTSKLTVQMRHSGKNLTIHFNTDADQVMNVTFRTTDKDWTEMLQEHSKEIESVFEDSNHTVKIKYLGEQR